MNPPVLRQDLSGKTFSDIASKKNRPRRIYGVEDPFPHQYQDYCLIHVSEVWDESKQYFGI